jgi:hypothetical protein
MVKVIARDTTGWLFVNDQFVTYLYLNDNLHFGDIGVDTGLYKGDEVTGYETGVANWTIWSLP